ncbi:DUF397 domain-containing protein [Streptomyces rimosus]|uniref:DUF397 domain-containing protein n=1 Tax=Streptomyces rimosus TaxID=1927 RepID=UPI00099C1C8C|nr:DUF397 domain-containing protein [Streptomyces rimosus]
MHEPQWLKSSFSEASGNNCVEIASTNSHIALRESEDSTRTIMTGPSAFRGLLIGIKTDVVGTR